MLRSEVQFTLWLYLLVWSGSFVGSTDVSVGDYPYHVSVQYDNVHSCSGALLNEKWILTTASCVYQNGLTGLNVRVGTSVASAGGREFEVKSITMHEDFGQYTYDNDIALLRLRGAMDYGAGALPIEIASSSYTIADDTVTSVTGWVQDSFGNSASNLTIVSAPIVNQTVCSSSLPVFKQLLDTMLCAGYMNSTLETCQGDPGSPLVSEEVLIGILSYGLGCYSATYPSIYTRISSYSSWIQSITGTLYY